MKLKTMQEVHNTDIFCTTDFPNEENFFKLKFPIKLWKLLHNCSSGAIQWGPNGKTILIDYNLFQCQYFEREVPMFKTRNMTSFVRQLNIYGFKKITNQVRNDSSRYCNLHEFYHEFFQYGRFDLLGKVKRNTPLTNSRFFKLHGSSSRSQVQMHRTAMTGALKTLNQSNIQILGLHNSDLNNSSTLAISSQHCYTVSLENSLKESRKDPHSNGSLKLEISQEYLHRIVMQSSSDSASEAVTNTMENKEAEELTTDFMEIEFEEMDVSEYIPPNHRVEVEKEFDGSNYVINFKVTDDSTQEFDSQTQNAEIMQLLTYDEQSLKLEDPAINTPISAEFNITEFDDFDIFIRDEQNVNNFIL